MNMKQIKVKNPRLQRGLDWLSGWREVALILLLGSACVLAAWILSRL